MTAHPMPCERCGQPHARCSAHTRAGKPCGQKPMLGQRVCRMHGGSAPQSIAAAEERVLAEGADAAVRKLWGGLEQATPVKDPVASMERLAGALEQLVDEAGRRVSELQHVAGGKDLTQLRAEVTLLERALGHLRGLLVDMARLGIAERHVELQQAQAEQVVGAVRVGLDALPELLPEQRSRFLGAFLGALGRGPETVPGQVTA